MAGGGSTVGGSDALFKAVPAMGGRKCVGPFEAYAATLSLIFPNHRYSAIVAATKPAPPSHSPAVAKLSPTRASGASLPLNTVSAAMATPNRPSPTIMPLASSTPSCLAEAGLAEASARRSQVQPTKAPTTTISVVDIGR